MLRAMGRLLRGRAVEWQPVGNLSTTGVDTSKGNGVPYSRAASRLLGIEADDEPGGSATRGPHHRQLRVGPIMCVPGDSVSNSNAANSSRQPIATVLVADDNRDMVESPASLLRIANYNVICTYSAQEALNVLDERGDVELVL